MGKPTGARVLGPLQPLARGFLFELVELGYSWTVQIQRLRLMAELSAWMVAQGVEPTELTASVIHEFLEPVRARGPKRQWFSSMSERQLVDYLCRLGLVAVPVPLVVIDPVELLVGEFVEYLVRERGLTDGSHTVWEYRRTARLFLAGRVDPDGGGLDGLTAGDVTRFVPRGSPQPRLHDIRHTFAVQTLLDWHRSRVDGGARECHKVCVRQERMEPHAFNTRQDPFPASFL